MDIIESKGKYFYDTLAAVFTGLSGYKIIGTFDQNILLKSESSEIYIGIGDDVREREIKSEAEKAVENRSVDFYIYVAYQIKKTSDEIGLQRKRWLIREKVERMLKPYTVLGKTFKTVQYVDDDDEENIYTENIVIKRIKVNDYLFAEGGTKDKFFEILRVDGEIIYRATMTA